MKFPRNPKEKGGWTIRPSYLLDVSMRIKSLADVEFIDDTTPSLEQIEMTLLAIEGMMNAPRPIDEWHEDIGDVLWWSFPIQEPPYCGSPLDADWPDYHTHWTPIIIPKQPKDEQD